MNLLQTVVAFVIVLGTLVVIHELGHYLVARYNRVRIEVFSIGFGAEIFGWTDRLAALIIPWIFTAYGTFLMRQHFITFPKEIEEAALAKEDDPASTARLDQPGRIPSAARRNPKHGGASLERPTPTISAPVRPGRLPQDIDPQKTLGDTGPSVPRAQSH